MKIKIILILLFSFLSFSVLSQDINDTSKIIIKRVVKSDPSMYNISEIYLKKDKDNQNLFIIRVNIDVPLSAKLRLSVKDTADDILMYLINDEIIPKGTYRVRWEMPFCKIQQNCDGYLPGRYLCEFETDQFIYVKDFFLK